MTGPANKPKSLDSMSPIKVAEVADSTNSSEVTNLEATEDTQLASVAPDVAVPRPGEPEAVLSPDGEPEPTNPSPAKPNHRWWRRPWVWVALMVVLSAAAAAAWWWLGRQPAAAPVAAAPQATSTPTPTPTPVTKADPLTGLPVDPATADQPVVGVMIENLAPDARPQSGLGQAGMVYEALAEGGITRFLALFQAPLPAQIGPVRSLRPYYLDWGLEHSVPVAHAGGSQPALAQIQPLGLKDINALAYDGSYFYRSTDRLAPHNLYITGDKLLALDNKLGFASTPTFAPLPRKADQPEATPSHPVIDINFSFSDYNVEYKYEASANDYLRFMGGAAHIDRNTGKQITVKNVVVQFVPTSYSTQPDGKPETDMKLIGSGKALFFMDGGVTVGTWSKASDGSQTTFADGSGQPMAFNAGNTWISVVPTVNTVGY